MYPPLVLPADVDDDADEVEHVKVKVKEESKGKQLSEISTRLASLK